MAVSFGSTAVEGKKRGKLEKLREIFTSTGDEPQEKIFLAEALYSRAPADYLESTPVETLAEIASEANDFFREYVRSGDPFRVEVKNSTAGGRFCTIILTAMGDRPFIVDTLTELLRVKQLRHQALLHPIVKQDDGRSSSLTYFELDPIEEPQGLADLRGEIERRFVDLIYITDDFAEMMKRVDQTGTALVAAATNGVSNEGERRELANFLRWLGDGGFLFLGHKEWLQQPGSPKLAAATDSSLGLFRSATSPIAGELLDVEAHLQSHAEQKTLYRFAKLVAESPVHRYGRMELVTIRLAGPREGESRYVAFLGLLTSKAMAQEAASIPVIRQKLQKILDLEGVVKNSHDYKEIISIVNGMPKSEFLQYPIEVLRGDIGMIYGLQGRAQLKTRYFLDPLKHLISILIVIPRERYSQGARLKILNAIEGLFNSRNASYEFHTTTTDYPLYVLHILLPNPSGGDLTVSAAELESVVLDHVLTWDDKFLARAPGAGIETRAARHYAQALPDSYKAAVQAPEAVLDISAIERLGAYTPLDISLDVVRGNGMYDLKLYKQGDDLTMSAIVPYLENCGLSIVQETVTPVAARNGAAAAIYNLRVRPKSGRPIELERAREVMLPGLKAVLAGKADNDRLNELMLHPGLNLREVHILRALTHYLWQIKASTSDQSSIAALVENPSVARKLVDFFRIKFDPAQFGGKVRGRGAKIDQCRDEFIEELKGVTQLMHDRTLRRLLNIVEACVRTNYYRSPDPSRLALKIDCKKIERMPTPRPFFEIFVIAPDFEGVHLRGGKVARGGLRWSDREDDYRTEVLGLMKTQMVKNSIIIPVGAKGGFVLKNRPANPAELGEAVKACYTRFVRSLLEVTDNRSVDGVQHPPACVVYDDEDPYFVVAADRGTATFSDVANQLAVEEFNFWLGDAFASGGSNGYDHKKLAITSRGVWEAVCRHFREIGIDPEQQEFSVVGIGDMSGDVFGNGLLRSRKAKLLAAFDHRHIFIDPSPDPEASFEERLRLFKLPQSKWSDYNPALISKGGGVFPRTQKEITLSPEAQQALGLTQSLLSGQELMRAILKAPADLLWNGGIGTYVKAADEDNLAVGDRANDEVRIDARELRVKVVGEGGNLGFTQRARIEYSKIGGHINTDAVDNSGGVNLSDLEVNLKILLSAPFARNEITMPERNKLLMSYADEECRKVVSRNRTQSRALSLGVRRSRKLLTSVRSFMQDLEAKGILDRKSEQLPDDETLNHRLQLKAGLTRPELAVLTGYAKMALFDTILDSSIPEDPFLERTLLSYFPQPVIERFSADILAHPLRREIIATEVANTLVERMGATFVFRSAEESGAPEAAIVKAFIAADAIIGADDLTRELEILDKPSGTRQHLLVLLRLAASIDHMSRWLLDHRNEQLGLAEIVARYREPFQLLVQETDRLATQVERNRFRETTKQLIVNGVPRELAHAVSSLSYSTVYLDIIEVSITTGAPVIEVAKLFAQLYVTLHVRPLLEQVADFEPADRWEESAVRTLAADVRRAVAKLSQTIIVSTGSAALTGMDAYLEPRKEIIARFKSTYHDLSGRPLSIPALLMMTNQLFLLSRV